MDRPETGVGHLPISIWAYKSNPGVKHIGRMAKNFYAAFEVGENETMSSMIDRDGASCYSGTSTTSSGERPKG